MGGGGVTGRAATGAAGIAGWATFGGAWEVIVGTTVVLVETGLFPPAGTSTITEHFGQRAFFPAYLASTLNFAVQAGQRHKTSDILRAFCKEC